MLGVLSSRPNWVPPPPHLQRSVAPRPLEEIHSLGGGGGGNRHSSTYFCDAGGGFSNIYYEFTKWVALYTVVSTTANRFGRLYLTLSVTSVEEKTS